MSAITLDLPDDLAERLRSVADHLPRILELGLRQLDKSSPSEFAGASDVLEFLAGLPSPEETLALRPTPALLARTKDLLERSRTDGLSPAEEDEWRRYEYLEHLVRLAKAKAALKLRPR
jgi:hypothetical protein